jgi:hypothetical protein
MAGITDLIGKRVIVVNQKRERLFVLNHGNQQLTILPQHLYDNFKVQWFEPQADNYLPLTEFSPHLRQSASLKHFTWEQVAAFAEVDRGMLSYQSGSRGDWKAVKEGGDGYLLVTVDGMPYWADAVGQIPFAVGCFKGVLRGGTVLGNEEEAIVQTLRIGQQFHDGNPLNILSTSKGDVSNNYDNHFVLRGALWASHRYDVVKKVNPFEDESKPLIEWEIVPGKINHPANKLAEPNTLELAKKYGLKK